MRTLQCEDRGSIISLLDSPSIKYDVWEWQFDSPHIDSSARPIVAVDKWNNVLGFNGLMPFRLWANSTELNAAWSCDFFVSGEARGKGVGKKIKQALKEQGELCFALGTSATAAVVLQQSGWIPYQHVYSYQRRVDGSPSSRSMVVGATDSIPAAEELDQLWHSVRSDYGAIAVRSSRYLQWRYAQSPVAKYSYLPEYEDGVLSGLAVIFEAEAYVSLVDYIGPRNSVSAKKQLLGKLLNTGKSVRCTTSCNLWGDLLVSRGFNKSDNPVNCFIYSANKELGEIIARDFFIMAGDCDGDILLSSVETKRLEDKSNLNGLTVTELNEQEFLEFERRWNELLEHSSVDNPFLSWEWVSTWWKSFSTVNGFIFRALCCWQGERLVGIAPIYERDYRRFGLKVSQLQLLGCSWSGPVTFRSEYLDFIVHKDFQRSARVELLQFMFSHLQWDELVLGDMPKESLTSRLLSEAYSGKQVYIRTGHEDISVRLPMDMDEDEYMGNLSANLRRSAFNMYDQLQADIQCQSEAYSHSSQLRFNLIDTINRFHLPRWGKLCFEANGRQFHEAVIDEFDRKHRIWIAAIVAGGEPISVAYNIVYKDSVYNLQLGFSSDPEFGRYSLGLLQLGQCIRFAMQDEKIRTFDLLAGFGKQDYYKSRFGGRHYHIDTKQYLRSWWMIILYKLYDHRSLGLYKNVKKVLGRIAKKAVRAH